MPIEILKDLDPNNAALATEWNDLLACCSASHVPFLRYEYLSAWWSTLGGGEWQDAELHTLLQRDERGRLQAVAPLFFTHHPAGTSACMFIGSIEISDYLDFIAPAELLPEFTAAVLEHLSELPATTWQALDLYNLPEETPSLPALQAAAERRGWRFAQERLQPCPVITLPGDWEAYLAGIDKKQRHEIRRKMRRAEEATPPARWYLASSETMPESELDAEMDAFMALMAMDPEKERFLTETMRKQMRLTAHAAYRNGWLQLAFIEVDGQKAAGYLNFDYAGHIWVYNSGLSFEHRELSPGWVLLGRLLQWANENNRRAFDFMRGDEDYKFRFGGVARYVARALVER